MARPSFVLQMRLSLGGADTGLPPSQATALAHPTRKVTANAAALRFDLARGPFARGSAAVRQRHSRRRGRKPMIEIYGTTFARIDEIKRGTLVRRLAGFHVVVDVRSIEDNGVRLWLNDGETITLGLEGLVEVAR